MFASRNTRVPLGNKTAIILDPSVPETNNNNRNHQQREDESLPLRAMGKCQRERKVAREREREGDLDTAPVGNRTKNNPWFVVRNACVCSRIDGHAHPERQHSRNAWCGGVTTYDRLRHKQLAAAYRGHTTRTCFMVHKL